MHMITIDGLTKQQVNLLDTMWSIDSAVDYEEWKSGLSEQTMNTVDTLEQMVMLAELDVVTDMGTAHGLLLDIMYK